MWLFGVFAKYLGWVRIPPLPPLVNNTNPRSREFVLFFAWHYWGIVIEFLRGGK